MQTVRGLIVVRTGEGRRVDLGGLGVDFKIWGHQTAGHLAIVEHPIEPGRLVPPHAHTMEDELSYVLAGRIGVRVGDEIAEAGAGCYIYKPCYVPHTFWNAGDEPARLLEIISPAGFENYFAEIGDLVARGEQLGGTAHRAIAARYQETHFSDWVEELKEQYGLKLLGEP